MYPPYTTPYEAFVLPPGVITYAIAFIVITLAVWAKKRDDRYAKQTLQDNEDPRPPE